MNSVVSLVELWAMRGIASLILQPSPSVYQQITKGRDCPSRLSGFQKKVYITQEAAAPHCLEAQRPKILVPTCHHSQHFYRQRPLNDLLEQHMPIGLKLMRRDGTSSRSFRDEGPQFLSLSLVLSWSKARNATSFVVSCFWSVFLLFFFIFHTAAWRPSLRV